MNIDSVESDMVGEHISCRLRTRSDGDQSIAADSRGGEDLNSRELIVMAPLVAERAAIVLGETIFGSAGA